MKAMAVELLNPRRTSGGWRMGSKSLDDREFSRRFEAKMPGCDASDPRVGWLISFRLRRLRPGFADVFSRSRCARWHDKEVGSMKKHHPLLVKCQAALGAFLVRQLVSTSRFHFRYADPTVNPELARRTGQRYIYAFFHEVMLFPAYFWAWPEMQILISDHRDGELITQVV